MTNEELKNKLERAHALLMELESITDDLKNESDDYQDWAWDVNDLNGKVSNECDRFEEILENDKTDLLECYRNCANGNCGRDQTKHSPDCAFTDDRDGAEHVVPEYMKQ